MLAVPFSYKITPPPSSEVILPPRREGQGGGEWGGICRQTYSTQAAAPKGQGESFLFL